MNRKKCYINGVGAVSMQYPEEMAYKQLQAVNYAEHPSYKELIPPAMIRRMAKGVKMGIFAANQAMKEAGIQLPDAIISGTGMGCLQDSEKFLSAILDNDEQFLTPTAFIQSTHNTVGAQIALQLGCKGYNFTYVNGGNSFENALLDGMMQLQNGEAETVIAGGVDEISDYTLGLLQTIGRVKKEENDIDFKCPVSDGVPYGEGATFFALSSRLQEQSYAEIVDVWVQNRVEPNALHDFIVRFLQKNKLTREAIDVIVLGYNADKRQQAVYNDVSAIFSDIPQVYYKHISAEYDTASAFGIKIAAEILQQQYIAPVLKWNDGTEKEINHILFFNQYMDKDFSLVVLKKC